ncbi:uncharacterized protein B0H64DRAFT_380883 [Chaetomium fimeti]|uniref:Heterokaryon incompatibility domain-containing protein n=1 Tax=Chaetomium fimeti TaxID=1854472 RepID=A0AAE0LWR4_9PEZI|nr:hypothetical protein B0H64DRAFT_380883 [Chaetomium fimeti]
MRLLNVDTFKLEEFFFSPPAYAILSHTWGSDSEEVSFRDVLDGRLDSDSTRPLKVKGSCKIAKEDGYQYIWIDTCCIDKTNSVELQEAINSMYRWYFEAAQCYAYLSDVQPGDNPNGNQSAFSSSRWFQRGWTLQELLAPLNLRFYDADWSCLGTKGDLCYLVETVTGIPTSFLLGMTDIHQASVAQRMSWAAKRVTKRPEDIAYSLLGIFGFSMPMIYGEGDKAFRRLQEQIMKDLGDDSILAWGFETDTALPNTTLDMVLGAALAPSPSSFANSGHVGVIDHGAHSPFEVHGGCIHLSMAVQATATRTFGLLQCGLEGDNDNVVGIPLVAAPGRPPGNYFRLDGRGARLLPKPVFDTSTTLVHLQLDGGRKSLSQAVGPCLIHIRKSVPGLELTSVHPRAYWHKERALIEAATEPTAGVRRILMRFQETAKNVADFVAVVEIDSEAQPSCNLMVASKETTLGEIDGCPDAWRDMVSGRQCAYNSSLSIYMDLQPIQASAQHRRYVLTPSAVPDMPDTTVSATTALEFSGLNALLDDLRQAREIHQSEEKERWAALTQEKQLVFQKQAELEKIRAQIAVLEHKARQLAEAVDQARAVKFDLLEKYTLAKRAEVDSWEMISGMERFIDTYNANAEDPEKAAVLSKTAGKILAFAVDRKYDSFTRRLIERADDVSVPDLRGMTPLHYAVRRGQDELVQMLLDKSANIDTRDELGMTPLHLAAQDGFINITVRLLEKGAKVSTNNAGNTAERLAKLAGHTQLVRLFQSHRRRRRNNPGPRFALPTARPIDPLTSRSVGITTMTREVTR